MQAEICNFADRTTPHTSKYEVNDVLIRLENNSNTLLQWFLTLIESKCHLFVTGFKFERVFAK